MLRIMKRESNCDTYQLNNNPRTGDYSVGLLQINLFGQLAYSRPPESALKVPETNIATAYKIFKAQGYQAWTTF